MNALDIILHYERGRGWKASFRILHVCYNGEYKLTPHEALEAAWKALNVCREVGVIA